MKLKTLKDLYEQQPIINGLGIKDNNPQHIFMKELRQEAIKWVKALHLPDVKISEDNNIETQMLDCSTTKLIRNSQAVIIIKLFNITKEELK